jgi:hypothetical protein
MHDPGLAPTGMGILPPQRAPRLGQRHALHHMQVDRDHQPRAVRPGFAMDQQGLGQRPHLVNRIQQNLRLGQLVGAHPHEMQRYPRLRRRAFLDHAGGVVAVPPERQDRTHPACLEPPQPPPPGLVRPPHIRVDLVEVRHDQPHPGVIHDPIPPPDPPPQRRQLSHGSHRGTQAHMDRDTASPVAYHPHGPSGKHPARRRRLSSPRVHHIPGRTPHP